MAFPGCLAPAAMTEGILQGEQSTHGSVPSVGTAGEQGVYPSGNQGRYLGFGFIPPGTLVDPWQHSFGHNGKHVQLMTKLWRFTLTLFPAAAQIIGWPRDLTLFFVLLLCFLQLMDNFHRPNMWSGDGDKPLAADPRSS